MPVRYLIDAARKLIVSTGVGRVTFDEIRAHQDLLLADPAFDASFNQLIDATEVTELDLSMEQAQVVAQRPIVAPTSRRAFVATKPAVFGLGRVMEVYHERQALVRIFYDHRSALEWLGLKEDRGR